MVVYISRGRCANCTRSKKVVKIHAHDDVRGLCRKCMEELSSKF